MLRALANEHERRIEFGSPEIRQQQQRSPAAALRHDAKGNSAIVIFHAYFFPTASKVPPFGAGCGRDLAS
jgi:hypothetical protein